MTTIKVKTLTSNLCKKGFRIVENDHTYFVLYIDGKKTSVKTKVSHGENEISDGLISKMAKQTFLSVKEFCDFAECKISEKEYVNKLKQDGVL